MGQTDRKERFMRGMAKIPPKSDCFSSTMPIIRVWTKEEGGGQKTKRVVSCWAKITFSGRDGEKEGSNVRKKEKASLIFRNMCKANVRTKRYFTRMGAIKGNKWQKGDA